MIRVTLDLTCSICDQDQFYLPVRADEGQQVRCANCAAFKCYSADLETAMLALSRDRKTCDKKTRFGQQRIRQDRANAA